MAKFESSLKTIRAAIWLAVVVVIVSAVGRYLYHRGVPQSQTRPTSGNVPAPATDWSAIDASIVEALKSAHAKAEDLANGKLDAWVSSLMKRVDEDFLEWYFSYWTQQIIGLKGIGHWVIGDSVTEKITEDIQEEFSKRVLRPQIAQMEIERTTREVLELYVTELSNALKTIPSKYNIPHPVWERHLEDIAVLTFNVEGSRQVSLTMKTVATSSAVAGGVAVKKLGPAIAKIGGKISAKLAGKATAKVAAKTGAKVAAKSGGKFLGPIVGVGVLIWDAWDHNHTKNIERPILRQSLVELFRRVEADTSARTGFRHCFNHRHNGSRGNQTTSQVKAMPHTPSAPRGMSALLRALDRRTS
jgi:hypothetical protein